MGSSSKYTIRVVVEGEYGKQIEEIYNNEDAYFVEDDNAVPSVIDVNTDTNSNVSTHSS